MSSSEAVAPRVLAFHLPQFHPIPENDAWWGKGFTEWTNTAKARPRFPGHYQPHLPADLGFYDLRLPEARAAQAELARDHGIGGFIYWHYWFGDGRQLLERPVNEIVTLGEPDFPFAIGWANQTWSGIWHGAEDRVLMEQRYPGPDDERAHFEMLLPMFTDPRYITVHGRPLFYVFRPEQLPDAAAFVDRWQSMATDAGLPGLYLIAEVSDLLGRGLAYTGSVADGFDASLYMRFPADDSGIGHQAMRAARRFGAGEVFRYRPEPMPVPDDPRLGRTYTTIYPGWDNSPRSGHRAVILHGSSPEKFRPHVRHAIDRVRGLSSDEQFVFVKSWNEWAEGNHLEPDRRFGTAYLEVIHDELENPSAPDRQRSGRAVSTIRSVVRDALPTGLRKRIQVLRYAGDNQECPCCTKTFSTFWPSGSTPQSQRPNTMCPQCNSLERHRLFWLYLHANPTLVSDGDRVLHVAPEAPVAALVQGMADVDYLSADLDPSKAMVEMDLTAIDLPDDRFDIILCSHVLEHIPDDRAAMAEMKRVLAPGGWAYLQVPMSPTRAETYEDRSITDPAAREKAFGQVDHVRSYGRDYEDRLREAGWTVDRIDFAATLSSEALRRYAIDADEAIYICR